MKKNIKDKVIDYVFKVSQQPILLRDLLQANAYYNEGMYVDGAKLGFRINIIKAYTAYAVVCLIIITPIFLLTHNFFANLDFHISVLGSIFTTSCVFIGFTFFKSYLKDGIARKQIKKAWAVHFPFFAYEKYNKKVEEAYQEALKKDIAKKDLEQYVLDTLLR
ncbi:MAG: hypothetical protein IBX44_05895 [Sulfurospirillum sp.]|nr:hypothetical protein [Sulfurospirillum sp.]